MLRVLASALVAFVTVDLASCTRAKIQEVESEPAPLPSPPGKAEAAPLSARLPRPEPERLVAIGDNASGNFVKVVQRIPVRLVWTDLPDDVRVAAGLSVNVTILTK